MKSGSGSFAAGAVVARADGQSRELFPVAIGLQEGLALRTGCAFCVENLGSTVEDERGDVHEWVGLRTGPSDVFRRDISELVDF